MQQTHTPPAQGNPWRYGYCDGLLGRECSSPWGSSGFKHIRRNAEYVAGYMRGEQARKNGVKLQKLN